MSLSRAKCMRVLPWTSRKKNGIQSNWGQSQAKQSTKWRHFIGSVTINKVDIGIDLRDVKWNALKIKNTSWSIFFPLWLMSTQLEFLWHIYKVKMEFHELCTMFLTAYSLCHWNNCHPPPHLVSPSKKESICAVRHVILNYREEICGIPNFLHPKLKHKNCTLNVFFRWKTLNSLWFLQ